MPANEKHHHATGAPAEPAVELPPSTTDSGSPDPAPPVGLPLDAAVPDTAASTPPAERVGPTRRERRMAGRQNSGSNGKINGRGLSSAPAPRQYINRRRGGR